MNIALYTLTSSLHDKSAVDAVTREFLSSIESILGYGFDFRGDDFSSYGKSDLDVIFIRTGGSLIRSRSISMKLMKCRLLHTILRLYRRNARHNYRT
mgnify:CR=1 FL=1